MKNIKKLLCVVIALISVFAFNACQKKELPPAQVMTIKKIISDYKGNALRAEETHMGKRYKCNAQVVAVKEDYVYAKVWAGSVCLYYNKDQKEFVMNLSEDDVITFEGTFTEIRIGPGYYGGMDFEDVIFVEKLYNNTPNGIHHYVIED